MFDYARYLGDIGHDNGFSARNLFLRFSLRIVALAGLRRPKPYARFMRQKDELGLRDLFVERLYPLCEAIIQLGKLSDPTGPKFAEAKEVSSLSKNIIMIFYRNLFPELRDFTVSKPKDGLTAGANILENCDYCFAEPAEDMLQRCGACKVARCCSKSCERAAWGSGHKEACRPSAAEKE